MPKFKFTIFDADVGGNVDEEVFDSSPSVLDEARTTLNSYELEEEYADQREIDENRSRSPNKICDKIKEFISSPFFDSISIWLPGHHRKITIAKIEENS